MKNIFLIPTPKQSKLYLYDDKLFISEFGYSLNRNIHITSDEKPKEGDWVYVFRGDVHRVEKAVHNNLQYWKKIILTTDTDLIKDGVQSIPNEFLEWFVKNPNCEKVDIIKVCSYPDCDCDLGICGNGINQKVYKIIIPKIDHKGKVLTEEEVMEGRSSQYEFIDFNKIAEQAHLSRLEDMLPTTFTDGFKIGYKLAKKEIPQFGTKEFVNMCESFLGGKPKQELERGITITHVKETTQIKCYDKFNQVLFAGDYVDVQRDGVHQIYEKEDKQLYFKPYGKEDKVSAYFSNDICKCDIDGNWIINDYYEPI